MTKTNRDQLARLIGDNFSPNVTFDRSSLATQCACYRAADAIIAACPKSDVSSSTEKATQVPDGWVAVPFHCTMEMIKAGDAEYADPLPVCGPDGEDADWFSPIQAAWYAMLGARPSLTGESDER